MNARIASQRLERLEGLARLWGVLYFFHPQLQNYDERWERTMIRAIPRVEAARTATQFAAALNETLLADLNDGLSFARALPRADAPPPVAPTTPAASALLGGFAYLDMRDAAAYQSRDYLARLTDALLPVLQAPGLILDMRWLQPPAAVDSDGSVLFGIALDKPIQGAATMQRVHHGWSEGGEQQSYGERLEVTPGATIVPIRDSRNATFVYSHRDHSALKSFSGPLAVLVNDLSYERLAPALDGLQDKRGALIVHETSGQVQSRYRLPLGNEAEAFLHLQQLVTADNSSDFKADIVRKSNSDPTRTIDAARRALAGHSRKRRSRKPHQARRHLSPVFEEPSTRSLSREERLLSLFKLWNCILHFFPHLELASIDWSTILPTWIPRIARAKKPNAYYSALMELTALLNDSHVGIYHPHAYDVFGRYTPPLALGRVGRRVVITAVDEATALPKELAVGTPVTHIDGRPVDALLRSMGRLVSASTPQALERDLLQMGRLTAGTRGSALRLTVLAGRKRQQVTLKRTTPREARWETGRDRLYEALPDGLGYVDLDALPSAQAFVDALRALRRTTGLILDMRGYPQFFAQRDVTKHLVRQPFQSGRFVTPVATAAQALGQHTWERWETQQLRYAPAGPRPYLKPVVVLIDCRTQSAAEDFCIYLRNEQRATFVGTPTVGMDGEITRVHLPGGAEVLFTGMRVLYADGSPFQNIGIIPDVLVRSTIRGIRSGRDEQLEAAVRVLKNVIDGRGRGRPAT